MNKALFFCWRWIKNRGVQVVLLLTLYLLLANFIPAKIHQQFYSVSILIRDLLVWVLPLTICFFIANMLSSFDKKAPLFILIMILFETISNLCTVWYAFGGAHAVCNLLPALQLPATNQNYETLWRFPFLKPSWWTVVSGTFLGIALGFLSIIFKKAQSSIRKGKNFAEWVLTKCFSRLIPIFVLGFVAQMHQTNKLQYIFAHYGPLLIWLIVLLLFYIAFLFIVGSRFSFSLAIRSVKNLLPAGSLAFTSGCSLSAMPWTIEGTSKNLQNPSFAKAVIPATANIQQVGDCLINAFLCFLIYRQFYGVNPEPWIWAQFSLVFVLFRFATSAVIGGAIFVMLPIYESYLSFTPEMLATILAFNIILDPFVTCGNVMANGALCKIFEKVWLKIARSAL